MFDSIITWLQETVSANYPLFGTSLQDCLLLWSLKEKLASNNALKKLSFFYLVVWLGGNHYPVVKKICHLTFSSIVMSSISKMFPIIFAMFTQCGTHLIFCIYLPAKLIFFNSLKITYQFTPSGPNSDRYQISPNNVNAIQPLKSWELRIWSPKLNFLDILINSPQ